MTLPSGGTAQLAVDMMNPRDFLPNTSNPNYAFTVGNTTANCVPEWSGFYENVTVMGSKAVMTYQFDPSLPWQSGAVVLDSVPDTSSALSNTQIDQFVENKRGMFRTVPANNTRSITIKAFYSPKALFGLKDPSDDDGLIRHLSSDSPAVQTTRNASALFYSTTSAAIPTGYITGPDGLPVPLAGGYPPVHFILRISYFCKLRDPKVVEMV